MEIEHLEHNIFLLMLNLSQLSDRGKIIDLFVDAINSLSADFSLRLMDEGEDSEAETIKIATTRNCFGRFAVEGDLPKLPRNSLTLIKNSIQMLAIILENRWQKEKLETANEELKKEITDRKQAENFVSIQRDLNIALSGATDLKEALTLLVKATIDLEGIDCGGVYLRDRDSGALNLIYSKGLSPGFVKKVSCYEVGSDREQFIMKGKPIFAEYSKWKVTKNDVLLKEGFRAIGIIPILYHDKVIACMNVASHILNNIPSTSQVALQTLASQTGRIIARLQAEEELAKHRQHLDKLVKERTAELTKNVKKLKKEITERKRADETIREKEKQLDNLLTNVDAIILEGTPTEIYYVGGQVEKILGYPKELWFDDPEGAIGFWSKHLHPDDLDKINTCSQAIANGADHSFEYRMIAADGREVWFYDTVTVETGEGKPIKTRSISIDITERKQAEKALKQTSDQLSLLLDTLPVVAFTSKAEGDLGATYLSESVTAVTGYKPDDFISSSSFWADRIHPDDKERVFANLSNIFEKGFHEQEYRWKIADGSYKWFGEISRLVKPADGTISHVAGVWYDITERKKAEKELENIFNLSPDMICVATPEGKLAKVNPAWEKVLGYTADEILKLGWAELVHPDDVEVTNKEVERQLKGSSVINFTNRFRCKDGAYKALEWQAMPSERGIVYATARDITERKRAEEEIKLLAKYPSENPNPVFRIKNDGTIQYANKAGKEVLEALTVKTGKYLLSKYKRMIKDIYDSQKSREIEFIHKGKIFSILITPFIDTDYLYCFGRDITERKKAEEKLREETFLSRTLLDNMPCVALLLRPKSREIVAMNEAAKKAGTIVGKQCYATWAKASKPCWFCRAPDVWATGEAKHVEIESAGIYWDANWVPITEDLYLHYAFDITDRKHAEEKLIENEERLQLALEAGRAGTWDWNIQTGEVVWDDRMQKIFGLKPGSYDSTYEMWAKLVHPDDREQADKATTESVKTGQPYECEYRVRLQRGGWRHVRAQAVVEQDKKGQSLRMTGIAVDITDRKQAEEELVKHREHLEELVKERTEKLEMAQKELVLKERLAALGKLIATVSHEIRNPLGTIRSSVFSIGKAIEQNQIENVNRALERAERNIVRCDTIIEELLDFTRIKDLNLEPTNIDSWLKETLREQTIPKGIECTYELHSDVVVSIDREYFRRVIINIVNNAVQALEDEESQGNKLKIKTKTANKKLEIRIIDNGIGIPDDMFENIFEPLFSTKGFGVGLGIPIVKDIMEQHGGGIEYQSKGGQETTAILWLSIPNK